jgi:DNA polymerase-3 subunit alpha
LGLYISAHPLADYEKELNKNSTLKFGDVSGGEEEGVDVSKLSSVRMSGIISDLKIKQSKKGNRFAVFTLEDFTGQGECVVFPQVYERSREILQNDSIVSVIGRPEENGNSIKLLVDEIKPLVRRASNSEDKNEIESITIKIRSNNFDASKLNEIKSIASRNGGNADQKNAAKLFINLDGTLMELPNVKINYDQYTKDLLSGIFGSENVIVN